MIHDDGESFNGWKVLTGRYGKHTSKAGPHSSRAIVALVSPVEADESPMAKILVVDDEPRVRQAFQLVLEANGHQVITAASKEEGERAAVEHRPDLMTVDVSMPEGTEGFHLVWKMRRMEDGALRDVPIIMVTGIHQTTYLTFYPDQTDGTYQPGEYLPVQGWLDKPVQADALLESVDTALGSRGGGSVDRRQRRESTTPGLAGQYWLLMLAAAGDARLDHVRAMKGAFFLSEALEERGLAPPYRFEAYHYGPFSRDVCDELDALVDAGLLCRESRGARAGFPTYRPSAEGRRKAEEMRGALGPGWDRYLTDLREWLDRQSFSSLWRFVQRRHPEYAGATILPHESGER